MKGFHAFAAAFAALLSAGRMTKMEAYNTLGGYESRGKGSKRSKSGKSYCSRSKYKPHDGNRPHGPQRRVYDLMQLHG